MTCAQRFLICRLLIRITNTQNITANTRIRRQTAAPFVVAVGRNDCSYLGVVGNKGFELQAFESRRNADLARLGLSRAVTAWFLRSAEEMGTDGPLTFRQRLQQSGDRREDRVAHWERAVEELRNGALAQRHVGVTAAGAVE